MKIESISSRVTLLYTNVDIVWRTFVETRLGKFEGLRFIFAAQKSLVGDSIYFASGEGEESVSMVFYDKNSVLMSYSSIKQV